MMRCLLVFLALVIVLPSSKPVGRLFEEEEEDVIGGGEWTFPVSIFKRQKEMDYEPEEPAEHGELNVEVSRFHRYMHVCK